MRKSPEALWNQHRSQEARNLLERLDAVCNACKCSHVANAPAPMTMISHFAAGNTHNGACNGYVDHEPRTPPPRERVRSDPTFLLLTSADHGGLDRMA